ncbi:hypothetical protein WOLCODRAFT_23931 [Wolfiporia cocos MD-104 SS10]|uniref:Uncharacterized protein n=1 Tax=Wolfiporia cocos (strain MD-104) TaxID=742152 RepID=A0A2H3JEA9_WOLCO|nr:hypothetical protein WOLCODRAFT_23931 [Wolfiporia cocos MD-104 SS10]
MPNHPAIECDTPRVRTDPGRPLPPSRATRLTNATRHTPRGPPDQGATSPSKISCLHRIPAPAV